MQINMTKQVTEQLETGSAYTRVSAVQHHPIKTTKVVTEYQSVVDILMEQQADFRRLRNISQHRQAYDQ